MIHDVHTPVSSGQPVRAIDGALREGGVCCVVRCLEEICKFIENVRDRGVGASVEKSYEACSRRDHFLEGGPGGEGEGRSRGRVSVGLQAAGCICVIEHADIDVIAVYEKNRDDFVGVGVKPGFHR